MTPLDAAQWEILLADHPDRQFVKYLLSGIREGFRIGTTRVNEPQETGTQRIQSNHLNDTGKDI